MSTSAIRLGILRLLDCAPAIVARERGLFADAGLDVTVVTEPSWANIADKLAYGHLDAALILGPLALAVMLGLRGRPADLRAAALVSREGNAIVLTPDLAADAAPAGGLAPALARRERLPCFAAVHAYSSHDLLLRGFLARQGIRAGTDATIIVLPPAEMPASLAAGAIDGFCAGAPWGAVAEQDDTGRIVITSGALAPGHPEKFLVIRGSLADRDPRLAGALRAALGAANALCAAESEQESLALMLSQPERLGLAPKILLRALRRESPGPLFLTGEALCPVAADAAWPLAAMRRHGWLDRIEEPVLEATLTRFVAEFEGAH